MKYPGSVVLPADPDLGEERPAGSPGGRGR